MIVISVFGSAMPQEGDVDYMSARLMGKLLAESGFAVQTGGYSGVMEAASRGANEAGGHVIGVTCEQIEIYRPLKANDWVIEEVKFRTLRERLLQLVENSDGVIVMPGGIGTLTELSLVWNFLQVGEISYRPMVAIGDLWENVINVFTDSPYVNPKHVKLVQLASNPEDAIEKLKAQFKES